MRHIFIKDMQNGEEILSFYILQRAQFKTGKNSRYIEFDLQDKTGVIRGMYWDADPDDLELIKDATVVKIRAQSYIYEDRIQLKILKFRAATEDDPIDWDALIEISDKDVEAMKEEFLTTIEEIDNPWVQTLLKNIFSNEEIANRFFFAPAGKRFHHCYRHGLLEHVINMIRLAKTMRNFYSDLNLNILIAGVIFHDFGKIWEYTDQVNIDFTDIGRLHGHIAMGYHFVMNEMEKIDNFPEKLKLEIGHLILSHQGELEKGSPIVPMTLEAIVLHHIDELDAKTNAIQRVLTKDRQPESRWTSYNRLMNRYFYRNDSDKTDEE